jgi:hypothetical protein
LKKVGVGEEDIVRRIYELKLEQVTGTYIMGNFVIIIFLKLYCEEETEKYEMGSICSKHGRKVKITQNFSLKN